MQATKQDFDSWWASPVAVEVRKMFQRYMGDLKSEALSEGAVRDSIAGAILVGQGKACRELLDMDFSTLEDFYVRED